MLNWLSYLGLKNNSSSLLIVLGQLSLFVILRHVLQCPRCYPRAPCPFGAVVQPQGLVANCAAEFVLEDLRNANMSVTFV